MPPPAPHPIHKLQEIITRHDQGRIPQKKGGGGYFITCIFGQYEKSFSSKMQMLQLLPVQWNITLVIIYDYLFLWESEQTKSGQILSPGELQKST